MSDILFLNARIVDPEKESASEPVDVKIEGGVPPVIDREADCGCFRCQG